VIASLEQVARLLQGQGVRFIVIGGWAAIIHGAARTTNDVDVVYARDADNIRYLVAALGSQQPYLRGVPPGLPFRWDERTIQAGLNFTLTTSVGDIDLLGEVTGGGTYDELLPFTDEVKAFDITLRVVTLERLIQLKRAAGRPKDLEVIAELQALLEERGPGQPPSEVEEKGRAENGAADI
jgi:predicted nucleotidyltransferase